METSQLISAALKAMKNRDLGTARDLLKRAINQDPQSEAGWILLGSCLEDHQQKIYCYRRALQINPSNETAQRFFRSLKVRPKDPPPPGKTKPAPSTPESAADGSQEPETTKDRAGKRNKLVFLITFLLGLITIGVPLWIRISSSNLPPDFIFKPARALVSLTGGDTAPEELWFPEFATITPTSGIEGALPAQTPSLQLSNDSSLLERINYVEPLISQASAMLDAGNNAEAIALWDQILGIVPEFAEGYYSRAANYWVLGTNNQRILSQAQQYYDLAFSDLEMARLLGPDRAVYYDLEYQISRTQGGLEEYRSTRYYWLDKALNALATEISKGFRVSAGNLLAGELLLNLGRCDQALAYFQTLEKAIGIPDQTSADIYSLLAQSHLCLQEYDQALEKIDRALELNPRDSSKQVKGIVLLNMGHLEESLEIFDSLILEKPHYHGRRYYFRALIHYELGDVDQTQADMETGVANTWGTKGLVSYLLGLLAIDQGDEELALQYLQEAEATMYTHDTPRFYDDTIRLISELGGSSLLSTPGIEPGSTPTPIPPLTNLEYLLPTPPTDLFNFQHTNYSGPGIYKQYAGGGMGKRFYPDEAIEISGAAAVFLRLDTDHDPDSLALRAACVPKAGNWNLDNYPEGTIELLPGENELLNPDECIFDTGLIYIVIWNMEDEDILVNNLELKLVAITPDGSEVTYGY